MSMKVLMAGVLLAAGSIAVLSSPQALRAASDRLAEFLDTQNEGGGHTHRGRRHRGGSDAEDRGDEADVGSRTTRWLGRPGLDAADEDERGPRSGRRMRAAREQGEDDGRGGAGRSPAGLDRRFSRFDSNGDGLVDAADFQARASDIAAAAARRFLKRFDGNGDGRVSREEYAGGAGAPGERFADLEPDGRDAGDAGEPRGGRGRGNVK